MAEDPKGFLKYLAEKNSLEAMDVLKQYSSTSSTTCVFCAEPGLDWNPLHRFPTTDLFVYADAGGDFDSLRGSIPPTIQQTCLILEPLGIELLRLGAREKPRVHMIKLYDHEIRLFLRFLMKFVIGSGLERARMNHFKARGILSGFCCALWSSSRTVAGAN